MHTTHQAFSTLDLSLASIFSLIHHASCFAFPSSLGGLHSNQKFYMREPGPRWLFRSTKKFGSIVLLALDVGTIPHSRFMFVILFAAFLATVQVTLFLACLLDGTLTHINITCVDTLHHRWIPGPRLYGRVSFHLPSRLFEHSAFFDFKYLYASQLALYLLLTEAFRFYVGGSNTLSTCWLELDGSDVGVSFLFSKK